MNSNHSLEYGTALYRLAVETGTSEGVLSDLRGACEVFSKNPEFVRMLLSPAETPQQRAEAVDTAFAGKIDENLLNFFKILAEKRRFQIVFDCLKVYERLYCADNGITAVRAASAVPLSEEQKKELISALEKKTGRKILLDCRVDKSCIGGIRLEYDGKRYDASVRGKLAGILSAVRNSEL